MKVKECFCRGLIKNKFKIFFLIHCTGIRNNMNQALLTKYNECARICGLAMSALKEKINAGQVNVGELSRWGNEFIQNQISQVYKKEKHKGVGYPVSISLNNCVGHYIYEGDQTLYNTIKKGDVIKVELGVNIGEAISMLGETFTVEPDNDHLSSFGSKPLSTLADDVDSKSHKRHIEFLNNIAPKVAKMMNATATNDDIRMFIESECTNNGCFPVENCVSYQMFPGHLLTEESKYIILNHQQYYDEDDLPVTPENICMDLSQGEVYTINLTIVPETNTDKEIKYVQPHNPHIYRFNDNFYNLRLKSSREFCSKAKGKHFNNAFWIGEYSDSPKMRMGLKETIDCGILDGFEVYYTKDYNPVYHKKFNVIVGEKEGQMLKYI
jgi:methionine aminopeptidase